MMQMLAAAGVPVLSDGIRSPDEDNPRGYFEFEAVKSIARDASWLTRARGKAVKVVAPLVPHLPRNLPYTVLWMERHVDEVLSSQAAMLERSGQPADPDDSLLRNAFARQAEGVRAELASRSLPTLFVSFGDTIADPERTAHEICSFVGGPLDTAAAADAVDPLLYHHRSYDSSPGQHGATT